MSWRTRGFYRDLTGADQAFLDRFNQAWDTKAEGRDRSDAMDWQSSGSHPVTAPDIHFNGEMDADFIRAMTAIASFTTPKRANNNGWRIRITLHSGDRFKIHFDSLEAALHL